MHAQLFVCDRLSYICLHTPGYTERVLLVCVCVCGGGGGGGLGGG